MFKYINVGLTSIAFRALLAIPVCVSVLALLISQSSAQVVINEFVYDDSSTDDRQFVELYNSGMNPVDISGWVIASNDEVGGNPDYTPAGGIPGGTMLAAGGYYVIGDDNPLVLPDLIAASDLENGGDDGETIELRNSTGVLQDAVLYEANKGTGFEPADVTSQIGGGYWPNIISIDGTLQSVSRWRDGRDTDVNGFDLGLIPMTPGASNNLPLNPNYQVPNVDALGVGSDVPGFTGSFVNPRVVDPTAADVDNPNAIPASPQGGNAIVSWDSAGGGNMGASNELANKFLISAYLDTDPYLDIGGEQTAYGLGSTGTFFNFADPSGLLLPGPDQTANGNVGVGWLYEKEDSAALAMLHLIDFGNGGDSNPGTDWTVIATIDLVAESSAWHTLGIDYDPTTGDVIATYDSQTFMFNTDTDRLGTFFVGYRESLVGVPLDLVRPPTFDILTTVVNGDFDGNGLYECADVNGLVAEIVAGSNNPDFDLTGNGTVDIDDLTAWRTEAGAGLVAPPLTASGNPVQESDANLDGLVDGQDFIEWNANKFTMLAEFCSGDFNADGFVDGSDFIIWNGEKFTSADVHAVPEPAIATWAVAVLLGLGWRRLARETNR